VAAASPAPLTGPRVDWPSQVAAESCRPEAAEAGLQESPAHLVEGTACPVRSLAAGTRSHHPVQTAGTGSLPCLGAQGIVQAEAY
jgi:hypothetical protein